MKIFNYIELRKKYNTLNLKYEELLETTKNEIFKSLLNKFKENEETKKLKEENKKLRKQIKEMKGKENGKRK